MFNELRSYIHKVVILILGTIIFEGTINILSCYRKEEKNKL